jgi:hypothetical protein
MTSPIRKPRPPRTPSAARRGKEQKDQTSNGAHAPASPWDEFIGMFKNDTDFARVKRHMSKHRRHKDADSTLP